MDKPQQINLESKSYMIVTNEYFGTKSPQYMLIRSELRGDGPTTLFLLGADQVMLSIKSSQKSKDEVTSEIYQAVANSIGEFLNNNEWVEGTTYYGTYLEDGTFDIGITKPGWEDGNWGQKIDI